MKRIFLSFYSLFFISTFVGANNIILTQNIKDKVEKTLYSSVNDVEGDYETVPLSEVKKILDENKAILIDVRNPDEIQKTGIIKGAKNIPLPELEGRLNELDKNQPYITFCAVGGRSKKAAAILSKNGFKKIYNAQEGMNSWPYPEMVEKK